MQLLQPQFKIFTHTVAPNAQLEVARAGTFINCLEANGPFRMALNDGAATEFKPGLVYDASVPFDRVRLINDTGTAVTVKLAIGAGGVRDTRLVLEANSLTTREEYSAEIFADATRTVAIGSVVQILPADPRRETMAILNVTDNDDALGWVRHDNSAIRGGLPIGPFDGVSINTTAAIFVYNPSPVAIEVSTLVTLREV